MDKSRISRCLFPLFALLILLAGGCAVGLAAAGVVSPREGEVTELDTPAVPTVLGQSAEEVLFYPWPLYETQTLRSLQNDTENPYLSDTGMNFLVRMLSDLPRLLGVSGMDSSLWDLQFTDGQGYWKDCPVTLLSDGTKGLMDVAFSCTGVQGCSWVVRSQGEDPSQEQLNQALETVRQDLYSFLTGQAVDSPLDILLTSACYSITDLCTAFPSGLSDLAWVLMDHIYAGRAWSSSPGDASLEELLEAHCAAAENAGLYTLQLVTTRRQVVAVFSTGELVVGVYYDASLGQYSGIGVNLSGTGRRDSPDFSASDEQASLF